MSAPAAPCKEGWGRACFSYKEKKPRLLLLFFFIPFEILSCCFAEVGALAAMASAKCCYTLGVLCSAHTSRSLCVGEIPVDSNMGMLPCSTSGRPQRRILGFKRQVSQKHVSLLTHLLNYFSCYLALQSASFGKAALANWAVCAAGYGHRRCFTRQSLDGSFPGLPEEELLQPQAALRRPRSEEPPPSMAKPSCSARGSELTSTGACAASSTSPVFLARSFHIVVYF